MVNVWRPAIENELTEEQKEDILLVLEWVQTPAFVAAMESYTWVVSTYLGRFGQGKFFIGIEASDEDYPLWIVPEVRLEGSRHHKKPLHITLLGNPRGTELDELEKFCTGVFLLTVTKWSRQPSRSAYKVGGDLLDMCEGCRQYGVSPGGGVWHVSL